MTLEEAIIHCEEVAQQQTKKAYGMGIQLVGSAKAKEQNDCVECANDHKQLASWLIEFKEMKEQSNSRLKHGHWYHNTCKYISELDAYFIQACCSCCGRYSDKIDIYSQIMSNESCSHCGAIMSSAEETDKKSIGGIKMYIQKEAILNDLEKLIEKSIECKNKTVSDSVVPILQNFIGYIKAFPEVDELPQKVGRWIGIKEYCKMNNLIPSGLASCFWCSNCQETSLERHNYCPNCGTIMLPSCYDEKE